MINQLHDNNFEYLFNHLIGSFGIKCSYSSNWFVAVLLYCRLSQHSIADFGVFYRPFIDAIHFSVSSPLDKQKSPTKVTNQVSARPHLCPCHIKCNKIREMEPSIRGPSINRATHTFSLLSISSMFGEDLQWFLARTFSGCFLLDLDLDLIAFIQSSFPQWHEMIVKFCR